MNIYLIRHCESLFNENEKNDLINCSLTLNGIEQSKQINSLEEFPKHYSLIICSPLFRSIQTFKYSNLTFDQFQINYLFREIYLGCKSDLLVENEIIQIENDQLIKQRIININQFLIEKKNEFDFKNILIITHADLIWHLTSYQLNGEQFGKWLKNGELIHWKQI